MRILLTGATGFIGRALVDRLLEDGHTPVALSRRPMPPHDWPPRAPMHTWPGPPTAIPIAALADIDAAINLAGASIGAKRWREQRKHMLFHSRIATTRALVDACARLPAPPQVVISASAVGYYGSYPDGVREFDESAPPGSDFLAVLCSHWEDEARRLVKSGIRLVLMRTGIVLGRGGGALPRMMLPFRFGAGGPVGTGRQVLSWIHLSDLLDLFCFALEQENLSGPLNAVAPYPAINREFARALGHAMHRPAILSTPRFVLRAAMGEMADLVLLGQRVFPKRALESGFAFRYPELDSALGDILQGSDGTA